jgi:DNA helicase HerA-like ATPase
MSQGLYLGRQVDPKTGTLGERILLDPADLLTHGLIVGMTGSGKTGLAIALLEEVLLQGIPVIAIDPKGDLGNLLLLFETLDAASFEPWMDPEAAKRDRKDVKAAAAAAAAAWTKGLADWGLTAQDAAALKAARDAVIYTPGSRAGVALNILQSLDAPQGSFDDAEEDLRDEIAGIVAGLLGLLRIDADPLSSKESIFLSNLIEHAWRAGKGFSLETLVSAVADPPFRKIGALPLETVFPRKDREGLMMALNNLLASPSFETWREGEPFDIERMLKVEDGRPRLSVVYTAHLSDEERLFVTALLLDKVKTWMRRQPGTTELRALVYMDEIFGYFPPHPANPPTKRPLLTLLKQARAQGVGIVLATQNPVDLDYKGLANMGTWLVGTLQTQQDRDRLRDGLTGSGLEASAIERLLGATKKRVFLLHDVHRPGPCLLNSRWALSYLRGPLTRGEISRLMKGRSTEGGSSPATNAATAARTTAAASAPPVAPAPFRHHYWSRYRGELADPHALVKYAVRYKGVAESVGLRAYPFTGNTPAEALEAEPVDLSEDALSTDAPSGVRYSDLPSWLDAGGAKALERALRDRLADKLAITLFVDSATRETSRPGETREGFAERLGAGGGGALAEKVKGQLDKKQRDLAMREQDLAGRKNEKWVALGSAVLQNIGLFTGHKKTITGASSVLTKNRMQGNAEARVDALRADVAQLEQQLQALTSVDPARFEAQEQVPAKTGVKLLRYDLLWIY